MGALRLLLAFTVVMAHSKPVFGLVFVGADTAVQAFYLISGFYMALVLNEKYFGEGSYRLFLSNRLLRLYPAYWAVLILTVTVALWQQLLTADSFKLSNFVDYAGMLKPGTLAYIIFTNLLLFGQDTIMFLKLTPDGALAFAENFRHVDKPFPPVYSFLFVPQAWSIGVELLFYLIAPFLVRKKTAFLGALLLASLSLRLFLYGIGLDHDPWTYRFFPAELAFFVLGALSYKIYFKMKSIKVDRFFLLLPLLAVFAFTLLYQFVPFPGKKAAYFVLLAASVPMIFMYSKDSKLDNYIGELSYPVYISHIIVLNAITRGFTNNGTLPYLTAMALIFLLSAALVFFVEKPVERYRQARVKSRQNANQGV